ncbi:GbsR/MarR family transcriptional regulator [Cohnella laeviribosi]|uniref:GbsR/MarR family transcriptional regulator n=1 Tax=Cohnella laeviribosi TaxID=380174 RepID=UPI003D258F9C
MNEYDDLPQDQVLKLKKARDRVIDSIGKNMDLYGITLSVGHLYGHMYFSDGPVTLDELSKKMEMSKTSMSTGVRTLVDLKMIDKVWGKGSRKDFYEVTPDWYQNFCDYFSIKWRKAVESNTNALTKSLNELRELRKECEGNERMTALIDMDEAKIVEALKYYRWLLRFIEALETGKIFELVPKESD